MDKQELGNRIKDRRSELGITQEDLAELSDTSAKTVREIEHGNANPRLNTLLNILAVLGLVFLIAALTSDGKKR
jgi:putative transcriptional regulator